MKEENEINEEVQQLLDCLEQHGRNVRRQKKLCDLIDSLAEEEKPVERPKKRRNLIPLWWVIGAAAAVLLLWLLAKPTMKETPRINEEILVEETETFDSIKEDMILEEPIIIEEFMAEETPIQPKKTQTKSIKPAEKAIEKIKEESLLAETTANETALTDTMTIGSKPIPNVPEEPVAIQSPQRRVIRSLNLVCYECQKEPDYTPHSSLLTPNLDKTLFGQPQDPNMKNGSLAFELKLH